MRPTVLLKSAVTIDGCTDDSTSERLLLSSTEDFRAVDLLRAEVDAILVGAGTVRIDNPGLRLRDPELSAKRVREGRTAHPAAIVLTRSGRLDPGLRFFDAAESERIVVAVGGTHCSAPEGIGLITLDDGPDVIPRLLDVLSARGIRSLLVEGGGTIIRQFLESGVVDRLRIAIAPRFLAQPGSPRMLESGVPLDARFRCVRVRMLGQMTVADLVPADGSVDGTSCAR